MAAMVNKRTQRRYSGETRGSREEKMAWAKREELFLLSDLVKTGKLPNRVGTRMIRHYIAKGVKNWQGVNVRLAAIRTGRLYYTSLERYWAFIEDSNV